ncbi:hypothetical protein B0O99DRAFT_621693 [Bisporella sp. PMI_857]|nr:hypothetical protein B0O99DRAFT_621693 [Bisporella sp. PMI_857]
MMWMTYLLFDLKRQSPGTRSTLSTSSTRSGSTTLRLQSTIIVHCLHTQLLKTRPKSLSQSQSSCLLQRHVKLQSAFHRSQRESLPLCQRLSFPLFPSHSQPKKTSIPRFRLKAPAWSAATCITQLTTATGARKSKIFDALLTRKDKRRQRSYRLDMREPMREPMRYRDVIACLVFIIVPERRIDDADVFKWDVTSKNGTRGFTN